MSNVCSGCGLHRCEGECYFASPSDFEDEKLTESKTDPFVHSPEYLAWIAEIDAKRNPKRRAA